MKKLFAIISLLTLIISGCSANQEELTLEEVRPLAKELFNDFTAKNKDKAEIGPCLGVIGNWAIDIAHSPREAIDNKPENMCAEYQNGAVEHLLEFSPRGQVITIK